MEPLRFAVVNCGRPFRRLGKLYAAINLHEKIKAVNRIYLYGGSQSRLDELRKICVKYGIQDAHIVSSKSLVPYLLGCKIEIDSIIVMTSRLEYVWDRIRFRREIPMCFRVVMQFCIGEGF